MRITRIDIEGREGRYATITRRRGSLWIEVMILTPYQPDGKEHRIAADADESELWNQARSLHLAIEGRQGTNSDIHDYLRELQRFADCCSAPTNTTHCAKNWACEPGLFCLYGATP